MVTGRQEVKGSIATHGKTPLKGGLCPKEACPSKGRKSLRGNSTSTILDYTTVSEWTDVESSRAEPLIAGERVGRGSVKLVGKPQ